MSEIKTIAEIETEITRCINRVDEITELIKDILDINIRNVAPLSMLRERDFLRNKIKILEWVLNKGDN